jgi:dipeptidyl aminopeptidase/acylaminoacyl peptidase
MSLFRRTIRFFLFVIGLLTALSVAAGTLLARYLVRPPRRTLFASPTDVGLAYEDAQFPARDGVRLSGWFVPGAGEATEKPAIVLLHGLGWNRLGTATGAVVDNIIGALPVDLLRLVQALHETGYSVLTFDLRNHGQSASSGATMWGLREANDVLGALDYLAAREDVATERIGALGFSIGANALLFALPHTTCIKAALLVQPATPRVFMDRFSADMFGPFARPINFIAQALYQASGGLKFQSIEPAAIAPSVTIPVLYLQGNHDRWGSLENVVQMSHSTPGAKTPAFVEANSRYQGHEYLINHPHVATDFFWQNL